MRITFLFIFTLFLGLNAHGSYETGVSQYEPMVIQNHVHLRGFNHPFFHEWRDLMYRPSDVQSFNRNRFTFLIHAGVSPRKLDSLLRNPYKLSQAFSFSASLIDQNHRTTYGKYGFILAAPPENIMATKPSDMGSPLTEAIHPSKLNEMKKDLRYDFLLSRFPVLSPQQILKDTIPHDYNEIMVAGTTFNGGAVYIVGAFFKTKNGLNTMAPEDFEKLKLLGRKYRVPIISIEAMPNNEF